MEKGDAKGEGWINAGIYILSRDVLEAVSKTGLVSIERDVFPSMIGEGMSAWKASGNFLDIGTPESYAAAEEFFRKRR